MDIDPIGIWWSGTWRSGEQPAQEVLAELEQLGYGAFWSSGGFDAGLSERFVDTLAATKRAIVASGVVTAWHSEPQEVARACDDLEARFPGRFLLGLGASHSALVEGYTRPYSRVVSFLDGLDHAGGAAGPGRRVLAALGDRMLRLAADRSAGAHPYFVPVEHTAHAREVLGPGVLLAPEVTVVLEADPARAREIARGFTAGYLSLPNYANNLRRLGFGEDDVAGPGSDRLVDAVIAWGDVERVAGRVRAHLDAGADHVCVQVVTASRGDFPLAQYRELAPALH